MIPLSLALGALCALVAVALVVLMIVDRRPTNLILNALVAVEIGMVVLLVLGVVRAFGGAPAGVSLWEYIGYLVVALVILPAGVIWSSAERSRSGTAVLLIATLLIPFLCYRINEIWPA